MGVDVDPQKVSIVDVTWAAGASTDQALITVQFNDNGGYPIRRVVGFEFWLSEDADGEGLTADSYSGDVTVSTGNELTELTSKKHFLINTNTAGKAIVAAVDSANPTDQYAVVRFGDKIFVSGASGTNWEGA